jgi:hypothetical protein
MKQTLILSTFTQSKRTLSETFCDLWNEDFPLLLF